MVLYKNLGYTMDCIFWILKCTISSRSNEEVTTLAVTTETANNSLHCFSFRKLDARLGHMAVTRMKQLFDLELLPESMLQGIDHEFFKRANAQTLDCVACVKGNLTRQSFRASAKYLLRSTRALGLLHADLIGPIQVQTPNHEQYALVVVDDYTGFVSVLFLKDKLSAVGEFIALLNLMSVEQNRRVNTIKYDNGSEIVTRDFRQYCRDKGIKLMAVPRYTPQLNGTAERKNRSVKDLTRTLMCDSALPRTYWGYALTYAAYLFNFHISSCRNFSKVSGLTPWELWFGVSPNYRVLQQWSAPVNLLPDAVRQGKFVFDAKTDQGFFLGLQDGNYIVLSSTRRVHLVPRGEVVFHFSGPSETGESHVLVGGQDVSFLDFAEDVMRYRYLQDRLQ